MDEDVSSHSFIAISEGNNHGWCPMLLGVSCAFFALRLLPEPEICDDKWTEIRARMLKGSAHLLGMLVWSVKKEFLIDGKFKKLECLQKEIAELKKRRSEAAKANEKVVRIFASREQSWFQDRKKLRQQIDGLMNDLGVLKEKKDKSIVELNEKLGETEALLLSKDELIYELELKRQEMEEKSTKAEILAEELRRHHSCELSKHKTAFVELVSSHRQLEAEMRRVLAQVQAATRELDSVLDQKDQLILGNQRLSMELVKMHNDLEQKDQLLFAMLRKSKLYTMEKEMLLEEVKSLKAKTKLEIERWKAISESKYRRRWFKKTNAVMEKKYEIVMEQNHHHLNINDVLLEQLKRKDEKLEAFRWQLMSMELESNKFQSQIEGLGHDVTQLRQDNMKLEGILLERDAELHLLKEQLLLHCSPKDPQEEENAKVYETSANELFHDIIPTPVSPQTEIIKTKDVTANVKMVNSADTGLSKRSNSTWTMDVQSLGVSYKVKRLKHQLLMLERLTGKKECCETNTGKGFNGLMSLLHKQADRYQTLQGKIDDLCKRMHENNHGESTIGRQDDEIKRLEPFLEETFQLQRYIVASGQKLPLVQTKIASAFGGDGEITGLDMKQFTDGIRTLIQEVQRGIEVWICRIIGELEGTLTSDGLQTSQK